MTNTTTVSTTISDAEHVIEQSLEALRKAPLSENIASGLQYLIPDGYRVVVELQEDGRKKRSTAAVSNWTPELGEIFIYFEPEEAGNSIPSPKPLVASAFAPPLPPKSNPQSEIPYDEVPDLHVTQLCEALATTEKAGRSFIALKWFRDEALPLHRFDWAESIEDRQKVLGRAIELGAVQTGKIANPKAPQHPTTTLRLDRTSRFAQSIPPRFQPIPVRGEPLSTTIVRDRGNF